MFTWDFITGDFITWFSGFYLTLCCLILFFAILIDVFRDETLVGWAKAVWVLFLVFVPFLSVIVYLIARHRSMSMRNAREQEVVGDE